MTASDKDKINQFSRLLARRNELRSSLARREKLHQLHIDAGDELLLLDDDARVQINVGDVFFYDDREEVEARVQETAEELRSEITDMQAKLTETVTEITQLKATLYAKFGNVCFGVPASAYAAGDACVESMRSRVY